MSLQKGWARGIGFFLGFISLVSMFFLGGFGIYNLASLPSAIIPAGIAAMFLWAGFTTQENSQKVNTYGGLGLTIIGVLAFFSLFGGFGIIGILGSVSYFSFIYLLIGIPTILIGIFSKVQDESLGKSSNVKSAKVYKGQKIMTSMKLQYIFYVVGVLFIFGSVWYFAREFIKELPNPIKLLLLVVAIAISFIIAEILRSKEL